MMLPLVLGSAQGLVGRASLDRNGVATPATRSAPRTSQAVTAVSEESMAPLNPNANRSAPLPFSETDINP